MRWGDPDVKGSGIPLPLALAAVLDDRSAGHRPVPRPEAGSLVDQLGYLRGVFGSQRKLAAAMGIDHAQISRWLAGKTQPGKTNKAKLAAMWRSPRVLSGLRKARIGPRREQRFRRPKRFTIDGLFRVSQDERRRRLTLSDLGLSHDTLDKMVDAYLAGDDQGAADAFEDWGIGADYGVPGMYAVEVYELDWG